MYHKTKHIRGVVESLLKRWDTGIAKRSDAAREAWEAVLSKEFKPHAILTGFKRGIITVITEDSAWLYRLTFEKEKILKEFNKQYHGRKKAKDIRFRIEAIEE